MLLEGFQFRHLLQQQDEECTKQQPSSFEEIYCPPTLDSGRKYRQLQGADLLFFPACAIEGAGVPKPRNEQHLLGEPLSKDLQRLELDRLGNPIDKFFYRPLDKPDSQIRLIRLSPCFGTIDASLRQLQFSETSHAERNRRDERVPQCTMDVFEIASAPDYHALSYTWGERDSPSTMLINGRRKEITKNLRTALEDITEHVANASVENSWLWVDAVCIDQISPHEKNAQVKLMADIYKRATRTLICPDPAFSRDSTAAGSVAAFLTRLAKSGHSLLQDTFGELHRQLAGPFGGPTGDRTLDSRPTWSFDTDPCLADAMQSFVSKVSWWRRAWIRQEVAHSRRSGMVMLCGSTKLDWEIIVRAVENFSEFKILKVFFDETDLTLHSLIGPMNIISDFLQTTGSPRAHTLADLLYWGHFAAKRAPEATVPGDLIFSMLSLASDAKESAILLNYILPYDALRRSVSAYLLRTKGAEAFQICCYNKNETSLLSWSYDWTTTTVNRPLQYCSSDGKHPCLYSASGRSRDFQYTISYNSLTIEATMVATVQDVCSAQELRNEEDAVRWLKDFDDFVLDHGLNDDDDVWKVPIADQELTPVSTGAFRASHSMEMAYYGLLGSDISEAPFETTYRLTMTSLLHNSRRTAFVTTDRKAGLCPSTAKTGDIVFVVAGADVPIILRRGHGNGYQMVGECYLHLGMDGELVNEQSVFESVVIH